MTRYDAVVADSTTADELLDAFAAKLVETLRDEAPMHRLWYDLRTQSMFEEQLREAVLFIDRTLEEMIWRVVSRYAELSGRAPRLTPASAYGVLDGLFQQALLGHLTGGASRARRPGRAGPRPDAADARGRGGPCVSAARCARGTMGPMRRILLLT